MVQYSLKCAYLVCVSSGLPKLTGEISIKIKDTKLFQYIIFIPISLLSKHKENYLNLKQLLWTYLNLFERPVTFMNFFELAATIMLSKALLRPPEDFYEPRGTVGTKIFFEAIVGNLNIYRLIFWFYFYWKFWSLNVYSFYRFAYNFA